MNKIKTAFITNHEFAMPTGVCIASLILNKDKDTSCDIYIIGSDLWQDDIDKFMSYESDTVNIHILPISNNDLKKFVITDYKVPPLSLLKINLAEFLPQEDKVLYIDGDTLILQDLFDVYSTDLKDNFVAAVQDMMAVVSNPKTENFQTEDYFNAGVQLLNLKKIRDEKKVEEFYKVKNEHPEFRWMDQDVSNYIFKDKIIWLPVKYNSMIGSALSFNYSIDQVNNFFKTAFTSFDDWQGQAAILHLTNQKRPWEYQECFLKKEWDFYWKSSAFCNDTIDYLDIPIQTRKPPKILLIFQNNFYRRYSGCNAYVYEIVKHLASKGCHIDFFAISQPNPEIDFFEEDNAQEKMIENFYSYDEKAKEIFSTETEMLDFLIHSEEYDFVNFQYLPQYNIIKQIHLPRQTRLIYTMHDNMTIQASFSQNESGIAKAFAEEYAMLKKCDKIICISFDEQMSAKHLFPNKQFYWLPHPAEPKKLPYHHKDIDLLFLAHNNNANLESFVWFLANVKPFLPEEIKLTCCGNIWKRIGLASPEFMANHEKFGVYGIDFAEDLDELYARTKVAIIPIVKGTGMKIKTIDAMSRGVPIVTTLLGVDGLPDKNENGCLVTDSPEIFASYIIRLINDAAFCEEQKITMTAYFKKYLSKENHIGVLDEAFELT